MDGFLPVARPGFEANPRLVPARAYNRPRPEVSIIIPARDEQNNIGRCLESLLAQAGLRFEIMVVDDGSTDRTREIALGCATVRVISAPVRPAGWTGKNNAVVAGAGQAGGEWLLFTDADTVHLPGSLARALAEARQENADLLSYSPEQMVDTFGERAVMPVIFAELAVQYPMPRGREQDGAVAAANGQYILVRRSAYDAVGGHASVATEILEDVALAQRFRAAGRRVWFRYGDDAVRTRMYRSWAELREGWTKNLALLFPHPMRSACQSFFYWMVAWLGLGSSVAGAWTNRWALVPFALVPVLVYGRVRAAHFSVVNSLLALAVGPPLFAYLLLRSSRAHAGGRVSWKGREYPTTAREVAVVRRQGSGKTVRPGSMPVLKP